MKLLFLHGWGLDASLWDGIRRSLNDHDTCCWDRGYFTVPQSAPPAGEPVLAIGHSLGSLLLALEPPAHCVGLVAINGFDRFVGYQAVSARVVDRMRQRLASNPREVLDSFRLRIGVGPHRGVVCADRLSKDLHTLATAVAPGTSLCRLLLQGGRDPLLPAAMQERTFAGAKRLIHPDAGHVLPLSHPEWCADAIRELIE